MGMIFKLHCHIAGLLKAIYHIRYSSFRHLVPASRCFQHGFDRVQWHRRTFGLSWRASDCASMRCAPLAKQRKLKLKAKVESSPSCFSFKRLALGTFNSGFIDSACTALSWGLGFRVQDAGY